MKKQENQEKKELTILKSEFPYLAKRYKYADNVYRETEEAWVFDSDSTFEGFLYGFLYQEKNMYVKAGYELLVSRELKHLPLSVYFRDRPIQMPGQAFRLVGSEKRPVSLAWGIEDCSFSRDSEGVYCNSSWAFFLSYGVFFPGKDQPRRIGWNAKSASLYGIDGAFLGWYVFAEDERDERRILRIEEEEI